MQPAVFVFDGTPGGVGLSEKLYASVPGWVSGALQLLSSCDCEAGCPACLLSARCEANNENLDKAKAVGLLRGMR
jgi:DEAD/DEAH box helicase domain-containing protein